MSERLPVISGAELIAALKKLGWEVIRQRGSHVSLGNQDRAALLVVPLHRELKRGTLAGILRDGVYGARNCAAASKPRRLKRQGVRSLIAYVRWLMIPKLAIALALLPRGLGFTAALTQAGG